MPQETSRRNGSRGQGTIAGALSYFTTVKARVALYIGAFVVITLVFWILGYFTPLNPASVFGISQLAPIQKLELDAYQEMNGLITTFTTGLLAGMGYILTSGKKINRSPETKSLALGSAAFAALSLFLGYFVYQVLVGQLDDQTFNLNVPLLLYPSIGHFYSFLLAVVFFGEFAFRAFFTEDRNESKPGASSH